ncbi:MAG: hypothetical protein FP826_10710 [Sphingomonadales bacterium]|nr:hypothetical protein [Sphingomonadales bacterium]
MGERESIIAWLRLYIGELDQLVGVSDGSAHAAAMSEAHSARTILFAIESGDYLNDLPPILTAPGN